LPTSLTKGADTEVLREMLQFVAERLMKADVEGRCGAGYGERGSSARTTAAHHARDIAPT
jgi:putative transposase